MTARKYGQTYHISGGAMYEVTDYARELAERHAAEVGVTDRFKFWTQACDGLFGCPDNYQYGDLPKEHRTHKARKCPGHYNLEPHGHAVWTGWTLA